MRNLKFNVLIFCLFINLFLIFFQHASVVHAEPPTLSKPYFDGNGTFSIFYSDANQRPPATIIVRAPLPVGMHSFDYSLQATGLGPSYSDTYKITIPLPQGSHTYQFFANNGIEDAIKAPGETGLGIDQEATFTLEHAVPTQNTSENSGGCSLIQSDSNNFKISSILFLMNIGFLFLRRRSVKN